MGAAKVCSTLNVSRTKPSTYRKVLAGRIIKSFRILAPGLETCQNKCFNEPDCVSYNLGPVEGNIRACELNDLDHEALPENIISKDGFEYCPIKVDIIINPWEGSGVERRGSGGRVEEAGGVGRGACFSPWTPEDLRGEG